MATHPETFTTITHTSGSQTLKLTPKLWPLINRKNTETVTTSGYLNFDIISTTPLQAASRLKLLPAAYMFDIISQALGALGNRPYCVLLHVTAGMMVSRELYVILNRFPKLRFQLIVQHSELALIDKAKTSRLIRYHSRLPIRLIALLDTMEIPANFNMPSLSLAGVMLSRDVFWQHYQQNQQQLGIFLDKMVSRYSSVFVDGVDNEHLYHFILHHQAQGIGYYPAG